MSIFCVKTRAGAAALGLWLATAGVVSAQDAVKPAVTPLDFSPPASSRADVDMAPTGSVAPIAGGRPASSVSTLDLSPPGSGSPSSEATPAKPATPRELDPPKAEIAPTKVDRPSSDPIGQNRGLNDPALATPPRSDPAGAAASPQPAPAAADAPSADPVSTELRAALDRFTPARPRPLGAANWTIAKGEISALYAERDYRPFWIEGDHFGARALAALRRLARADEDALDLSVAPPPPSILANTSPRGLAEADVALSAAVAVYALQASGGRLNPRFMFKDVGAAPQVAKAGEVLKNVAAADDPEAALEAFNPPHAGYKALRSALADLRARAAKPVAQFGVGPVLKVGMADPRVPLIRTRFRLGGLSDLTASDVYDVKVASAIAAFQRVHGLSPNGALTPATAAALDGAALDARRERLLIANMEMWRWEPRDMGETRVEVNIPDYSLKLTSGGTVIHRARVIVGKPDTPTPIFSNSIKYLLFNPVWRVPESIVKKEMEPKLAGDPNYLQRHGYKVTYVGDKLTVEQPPGEANALGRMLFLFPNDYAVYLHDTPSRSLFQTSNRALSHGCVRVEDPARLAEILMGGASRGWTEAKVGSLLGDKERTLALPVATPIHLQYFTAFVDESGVLREREDLYGLTEKVAAALASGRRD